MERMKLHILAALTLLLPLSCVMSADYDAQEFDGRTLPRLTGYNGSAGETEDWIYLNITEGKMLNAKEFSGDMTEAERFGRLDWDLGFCGKHLRTNSGTSGRGDGGAIDMGTIEYEKLTSVGQLPSEAVWVEDDDKTVELTYSQRDWQRYVISQGWDLSSQPWFDPNSGPRSRLGSANALLDGAIVVSGPPMTYSPSYHVYVIRSADGRRYFKLYIVSWYDPKAPIGDGGGMISYYVDELGR